MTLTQITRIYPDRGGMMRRCRPISISVGRGHDAAVPADLDLGKYNQDSGYSRLHAANFDGQEHVVHSNATNPQSADGGSITIGGGHD